MSLNLPVANDLNRGRLIGVFLLRSLHRRLLGLAGLLVKQSRETAVRIVFVGLAHQNRLAQRNEADRIGSFGLHRIGSLLRDGRFGHHLNRVRLDIERQTLSRARRTRGREEHGHESERADE